MKILDELPFNLFEAAHLAIMHEHELPVLKGMAIGLIDL